MAETSSLLNCRTGYSVPRVRISSPPQKASKWAPFCVGDSIDALRALVPLTLPYPQAPSLGEGVRRRSGEASKWAPFCVGDAGGPCCAGPCPHLLRYPIPKPLPSGKGFAAEAASGVPTGRLRAHCALSGPLIGPEVSFYPCFCSFRSSCWTGRSTICTRRGGIPAKTGRGGEYLLGALPP